MALYEWECEAHGRFEAFYKMATKPEQAPCPVCGADSRQVLIIGGVQGDELPSWLQHEHAIGCVKSVGDKPITSRTEYRNHLKAKGIIEHSAGREI